MAVKRMVKKPKLSDEERAARNRANQRAWRERNADAVWARMAERFEQRREYRRTYTAAHRQVLLDASCAPNPVG